MTILEVKRYKSIDSIEIELRPLTVLIGPPAGGKSNLLEAIALVGMVGRLADAEAQYSSEDAFCANEPSPRELLRIVDPLEAFPWLDYREPAEATLRGESAATVHMEPGSDSLLLEARLAGLSLRAAIPLAEEGGKRCLLEPARLGKLLAKGRRRRGVIEEVDEKALDMVTENAPRARLYGYERYSIERRIGEVTRCSRPVCREPRTILSETAANLAPIASKSPLALRRLHTWLHDELGAEIEVLVRRHGIHELLFFSNQVEIPPHLVSDTILRTLYYLLALYTNTRHHRIHRAPTIILLEEPEARVFPYGFEVLAPEIAEAVEEGVYVALTTHNGLLLSKLLDTLPEDRLAVYYIYQGPGGYTRAAPVPIHRLAEKMMLLEDLLVMKPAEVLHELGYT